MKLVTVLAFLPTFGVLAAGCVAGSATTESQQSPPRVTAPRGVVVPVTRATSYGGKAIVSWGLEVRDHGVSVVSALGDHGDVVFHLSFQRLGDDVLVTADHRAEQVRITKTGAVDTIIAARGASRLGALGGLKRDVEAWRSASVVAYDCASSTAAYYAALAQQVIACLTPEPLEPAACVGATLAAAVAAYAMNQDCQPQNCVQDWQCTDAYGSGYSCQQGACVQSTAYTTGCQSDADCGGGGFVCDETSGICYQESDGGGGDDGDCSTDSDCSDGDCSWSTSSCSYEE